jgi:hypothetical protein
MIWKKSELCIARAGNIPKVAMARVCHADSSDRLERSDGLPCFVLTRRSLPSRRSQTESLAIKGLDEFCPAVGDESDLAVN